MLVETIEKPLAYKPDEVARLLSLSARKVDEMIATKELRSFKSGKCRRVTAAALAEYICKQEKAAR